MKSRIEAINKSLQNTKKLSDKIRGGKREIDLSSEIDFLTNDSEKLLAELRSNSENEVLPKKTTESDLIEAPNKPIKAAKKHLPNWRNWLPPTVLSLIMPTTLGTLILVGKIVVAGTLLGLAASNPVGIAVLVVGALLFAGFALKMAYNKRQQDKAFNEQQERLIVEEVVRGNSHQKIGNFLEGKSHHSEHSGKLVDYDAKSASNPPYIHLKNSGDLGQSEISPEKIAGAPSLNEEDRCGLTP